MGNVVQKVLTRAALPGVHSYTMTRDQTKIVDKQGHQMHVAAWLDPVSGTATKWRPDAIPLMRCAPRGASAADGGDVVILYAHGNAEDVAMTAHWVRQLSDRLRCEVYVYDYTGYGVNRVSPSEDAMYANVTSAVRYLRDYCGHTNIVLYGRSVGSAAALFGATHQRGIAGVVLQSAFRSILSTRLPYVPVCFDLMCNERLIQRCHVPVLLVHGTLDKVVPFSHAKVLAEAECVWGTLWLHGAGHNNIDSTPAFRDEMCAKIDHFLRHVDPRRAGVTMRNVRRRGRLLR